MKVEDYHMKVPVPIGVYADFECNNQPTDGPKGDREASVAIVPKVLYKQIPIAVGFYLISPFGNQYDSHFGVDCVEWFVNEMLILENIASNFFETHFELEITPQEEESFQQSTICWLCEQALREKIHSVIPKVLLMIKFEITIILQASTEEQLTTGVI